MCRSQHRIASNSEKNVIWIVASPRTVSLGKMSNISEVMLTLQGRAEIITIKKKKKQPLKHVRCTAMSGLEQ